MIPSKTKMVDTIGLQGVLKVIVINRRGEIVYKFSDQNMIMSSAKVALANLIGGDGAGKSVTQIALGNSDAVPSPDDTSIGGIVSTSLEVGQNVVSDVKVAYLKTLTSHSYPIAGRIQFDWALDFGEANDLAIQEYGLVCSDLTLFARKTRGLITKSSDLSIAGSWTIIF